jgi:O-antigen ligase
LLSPILLNITNESKWSNDHYITSIEISNLKDTKAKDLLMANYKDVKNVTKKSYLIFKSKILHRTMIWSYTSEKIKENIFFGKGLYSSRKLGETDTIKLVDKTRDNETILYPSIPLHPHNNVLQIWLELGLVGIFLFLSLHLYLWAFLCKKLNLNNIRDIIIALPFFSVLIVNQISFGAFQTWWLAATAYFVIFINIFLKIKPN